MDNTNGLRLCDVCSGDTNKLKGGHIIDGDSTGYLTFLCPPCYNLSYDIYDAIKSRKYVSMPSIEGAKYISSKPNGPKCLKIFYILTENWNSEHFYISFYRLLLAFISGLDEHPEMRTSLFNITFALTHGIGFPCEKRTTIFYSLNNCMSTTANAILFRRKTRKNIILTTDKHVVTAEVAEHHTCGHCSKEGAKFLCNKCKGMYFCSEQCSKLGKNTHDGPCSEVYDMDVRLKTIEDEVEEIWSPKGKKQRCY